MVRADEGRGFAEMESHIESHASCACGQLSLTCRGEPTSVSLCNCAQCRRRTGSAFGIAAFFPRDAVLIEGHAARYARSSDSGFEVVFHFCGDCGSTVYWEPQRKPSMVAVAAGCILDGAPLAPQKVAYGEQQSPWLRIHLRGDDDARHDESLERSRDL